jgi:hypothetical protein
LLQWIVIQWIVERASRQMAKFVSKVEITDSSPPWHIVRVPRAEVADFGFSGNLRRVVCTLNGTETFNCALFPSRGEYFITLSKALRNRLGVDVGDEIGVELSKDESEFGMPMPEEFAEVLRQDPEGSKLFEALSPGNQRLMLKLVDFVKDVDRRIVRSLVGVEVLKELGGRFDYRIIHDAMRVATARTVRK